MSRAPSYKNRQRVKLTADQVRARQSHKQAAADMALFVMQGGRQAWERELIRRRRESLERNRARVKALLLLRAVPQPPEQLGLDLEQAA